MRRCLQFRAYAFLLITFFASLRLASFGQTTVLTRAEFSRFSVVERAKFFEPTISRIASEEQVDPYLLWTIAYNETRFRPWLRSFAGAEGLMQFIPSTAVRFGLFNSYQPEPAIRAAARYVRFLSNRFGGRVDSILAGYNAGEGAVDAYLMGKTVRNGKKIINGGGATTVGGVPPYRETIEYVARGLAIYRLLRTRQIFPGVFATAVYPPAVSFSVARVWVSDPEINFSGSILTQISNPFFLNAQPIRENSFAQSNEQSIQPKFASVKFIRRGAPNKQSNSSVISVDAVSENPPNNDEKAEKPIFRNEVFYEPRTGERFQNHEGRMERIAESGERIVGEQTRISNSLTIRARGSFFGGSTTKVSQK